MKELIQLTDEPIYFPKLSNICGHIFLGSYENTNTAILIVSPDKNSMIGKLSINLSEIAEQCGPGEFYVKLYAEGNYVNEECFETGLFEKMSMPFSRVGDYPGVMFQKWRLLNYDGITKNYT